MTKLSPVRVEYDSPIVVKIMSEISRSKPAHMTVRNLDTGELQCVIVNTVLENLLRDNFHADSYIGKCFWIKKLTPRAGKNYAEFELKLVELAEESAKQLIKWESTEPIVAEDREPKRERGWFPTREEYEALRRTPHRDAWYFKYLQRKLWKAKIKPPILERDNHCCRRCGGHAYTVHHRSYDYDVISGEDAEQLVAICEGCHNFIHYDDFAVKRSSAESDRLLLQTRDIETCVPPKIDGRTRFPLQWKRMSAVQRSEYDRLWTIRKMQRWTPQQIENNRTVLRNIGGLDDAAIDSEIEKASVRSNKKKK